MDREGKAGKLERQNKIVIINSGWNYKNKKEEERINKEEELQYCTVYIIEFYFLDDLDRTVVIVEVVVVETKLYLFFIAFIIYL
jgi:hypothetical protein